MNNLKNSQQSTHRTHLSDGANTQPGLYWLGMLGVVLFATVLRLVFFNGPFGSDDIVYLNRANEIAQGIWNTANYNGALRYGFNIPAAMFIALFGLSIEVANLWSLCCSIAEVILVYVVACAIWGWRAGLFAGLLLASVPLHVALAGRIHADPIVAFFISLSFVLLLVSERRSSAGLYFLTGLVMGFVFWVKELAIVYLAAFFPYPLLVWEVRLKWLWVIAGGIAMLLGHFLLMYWIAGDPLHLITIVTSAVDTNFIQGQQGEDGAWYYFRYLFFDIKHTALVPFLAVFGMVLWAWRRQAQQRMRSDGYIVYWMCALIFVLSFTVVSVDPLRLIMKQSNYLNLFIAPIALFAGYFLWRIQLRYALFLLSIALPLGVGLSALEQQAYRVFTSNSQAAVQYAREHPHDYFLGSVNNANLASIHAILDQDPDLDLRFNYLLRTDAPDYAEQLEGIEAPYVYVVLDRETQFWGAKGFTIEQVPECWQSVTNLEPQGFGAGQWVVRLGLNLAHWLPDAVGARVQGALQPLAKPKLATVYRVERQRIWCQ